MQSTCRAYECIGRYGGEEFCILLADTPITNAVDFAERLRSTIAETAFTYNDSCLSMTVSIGVAQRGPQTPDMATLIECADDALFEAKRLGRNCVQAMTNRHEAPAFSCDSTFVAAVPAWSS